MNKQKHKWAKVYEETNEVYSGVSFFELQCLEGNRAEAGSGPSWKGTGAKLGQVKVCRTEESLDFQAEAH